MNIVHPIDRPYDNTYRTAQASQTRVAILDALVRVLARGVADLSVPAIAREAGVSTRTVYRNFPAKRDLLAALNDHLDARIGYQLTPDLAGPGELMAQVRAYFHALDDMDDAVRAARMNPVAEEARQGYAGGLPLKHQAIASALASLTDQMSPAAHAHLFDLAATLFSQFTLQRMKDELGLTAAQAADTVVWAMETCIAAARNTKTEEAGDAPAPLHR